MRIKWWKLLLLNALIASGYGFFSSLATLALVGKIDDWVWAFAGAFIMAGLAFFTTCKSYMEVKDSDAERKEPPKEETKAHTRIGTFKDHSIIIESPKKRMAKLLSKCPSLMFL